MNHDTQIVEASIGREETDGITAGKYARLETGMSYTDAMKIMGSSGEEVSRVEIPGNLTVMYAWENPDGSNMSAMFQNGGLTMKTQFGLH